MKKEQDRMKELIKIIKEADEAYFEKAKPIMSDTEYDQLYNELVKLENIYGQLPDSPTSYIPDEDSNHLQKVDHGIIPMLSQEKCHTAEEIRNFVRRTNDTKYIVDLKLDGISVCLKYKKGKLIQAVTRGNGHYGYDITATVKNMDGFPKQLKQVIDIEIRGECLINEADFEFFNTNGEYSNSRNFVAGTLNALDTSLAKARRLFICCYDIRSINGKAGQNMPTEDAHNFIQNLGFMTVKHWIFKSNEIDKMIKFCEDFNKTIRPTIACSIDGLVIKSNDEKIIDKLGYTSKFPKSSIAFKFDSLNRTTVLRAVEWQVGRTGQVTPVGIFDEIEIDGVKINKASLANIENISSLDIKINDTIVVERRNDVIPKIVSVIKEKRTNNEQPIIEPDKCPICNKKITRKGPLLFCTNEDCDARIVNKLAHFCSRDAMNIQDLSDKTIEAIRNAGIPLDSFEDFYLLHEHKDKMINIDGFGLKKVSNILSEIERSNKNYLHQLIYGLCIPNVGLSKAKAIANCYNNIAELNDAIGNKTFEETISKLPDFGPTVIKSIMDWMNKNCWLLLAFDYIGDFHTEKRPVNNSSKLTGKNIVITGELSKPRKEIQEELESYGIKVSSSVSKNTNYLLVGDNNQDTNSSKYQKAIQLNIEIIEESDFRKML